MCWRVSREARLCVSHVRCPVGEDAFPLLRAELLCLLSGDEDAWCGVLSEAVERAPMGMGDAVDLHCGLRYRVWCVLVDEERMSIRADHPRAKETIAAGRPQWRPYDEMAASLCAAPSSTGVGPRSLALSTACDVAALTLYRACCFGEPTAAVACARSGLALAALVAVGLDARSYDEHECEDVSLVERHTVGDVRMHGEELASKG